MTIIFNWTQSKFGEKELKYIHLSTCMCTMTSKHVYVHYDMTLCTLRNIAGFKDLSMVYFIFGHQRTWFAVEYVNGGADRDTLD